jgi:hypothetical protein
LKSIRESPAYWEKAKQDTFTFVRQVGMPTWFLTLTASEISWFDFHKVYYEREGEKFVDDFFTEDHFFKMTPEQKCENLRKDPVFAIMHFQKRLNSFMDNVLISRFHPLGVISHHVIKIEFQKRGSPHAHILLWIKNAPYVNKSQKEVDEIIRFLDGKINANVPNPMDHPEHERENVETLKQQILTHQKHKHDGCKKKRKSGCHYGFPRPIS